MLINYYIIVAVLAGGEQVMKVLSRNSRTTGVWPFILKSGWWRIPGVFMLTVFLARAAVMGELYPFGTSFLAAVCLYKPGLGIVALAGSILGMLITLKGWALAGYLICQLIIYIAISHTKQAGKYWLTVPALVVAVHLLVRGSFTILLKEDVYLWVGVIFEGFFAGILTLAAVTGVRAAPRIFGKPILSIEERTSLGLLILGALIGLGGLDIFGIGVQSVFCRWLVLTGALLGGPGGGAAAGVAMGIIPSLEGTLTTGPIAFYALAGLLGGIFISFGRIGAVIGFTLANLLLSLFFPDQSTIVQSLKETGLAVAAFYLFKVPVNPEQYAGVGEDTWERENFKSFFIERLRKTSQLFFELERVFAAKVPERDKQEFSILFQKVSSMVCGGCSLRRVCWEQDFYKTYRALVEACASLEQAGSVSEKDFSADLRCRCMRLRELTMALNAQLELLKMIHTYNRQIDNCRQLVNTQLKGLGHIIGDFAEELDREAIHNQATSGFLQKNLTDKGISLESLIVTETPEGWREISITQKACHGKNLCRAMVAPNISQALDTVFIRLEEKCCASPGQTHCEYRLIPGSTLEVKVGKAQCAKDGASISGDICTHLPLLNQRFALLMSDGMGSGPEANAESNAAIKLLEKLLGAGFSLVTAVKTVNSALFLRSGQESFATLDLIVIDQVTGLAEFVKIGGAPTVISSKNGIRFVKAAAPPAGILDSIEPQIFKAVVAPEHDVIMMSDGVWEAIYHAGGPAGWFEDVLQKISSTSPQELAGYLLFLAKKAVGDLVQDDMSILVARIERRNL